MQVEHGIYDANRSHSCVATRYLIIAYGDGKFDVHNNTLYASSSHSLVSFCYHKLEFDDTRVRMRVYIADITTIYANTMDTNIDW